MAGVIGHIANPTLDQSVELSRSAEAAGAEWIGLADAFWWRDVWMQLAAVASATSSIAIGPAMTNPYMRHRFHTVAALATLQELAPDRTFVGITAGGSEVTAAAHLSRRDAPGRVEELVSTLRGVAAGEPLDSASGRALDLDLAPVPVLMGARGDAMLRTAGRLADRVLLWAIPDSDLERSIRLVDEGAAGRHHRPELVWAPLVEHDPSLRPSLMHVAVYASLNTRPSIRAGWGLDDTLVERIRAALVAGGTAAAISLVPDAALADLVVEQAEPSAVAARAADLGIGSLAVPGYGVDIVAAHVRWARDAEVVLADG